MAKNSAVNLDITNNADGFDVSGGSTARKLTVTGADVTITGTGANTYTFPSASDELLGSSATQNISNKTFTDDIVGGTNASIAGSLIVTGSVSAGSFFGDGSALTGVSGVSDHGGLTGLADDDHGQYLLTDGTRVGSQLISAGSLLVGSSVVNGAYLMQVQDGAIVADNSNVDPQVVKISSDRHIGAFDSMFGILHSGSLHGENSTSFGIDSSGLLKHEDAGVFTVHASAATSTAGYAIRAESESGSVGYLSCQNLNEANVFTIDHHGNVVVGSGNNTGSVTAGSFKGDGSGITGISVSLGSGDVKAFNLGSTNNPTDNQLASYDSATGLFTWVDAAAPGGAAGSVFENRYIAGELTTSTPIVHWRVPGTGSIIDAFVSTASLPDGADFLLDLRKNSNTTGSSIFSSDVAMDIPQTATASNGVYTGSSTLDAAHQPVAVGDVIFWTITQTGSVTVPVDLQATIVWLPD